MEDSNFNNAAENMSNLLNNLLPAMNEAMGMINKAKPISTRSVKIEDYKIFASLTESKAVFLEFETQEIAKYFYDNLPTRQ